MEREDLIFLLILIQLQKAYFERCMLIDSGQLQFVRGKEEGVQSGNKLTLSLRCATLVPIHATAEHPFNVLAFLSALPLIASLPYFYSCARPYIILRG